MRDNSKRIKPNLSDDLSSVIATNQQQEQNIFNFATPTDFVKLPSGGKYYPPNHPLHNIDTVEIRYMTAKDEDILTSKALIKQGIVIDRLIESVVLDKRIKTADLLSGDKNALLVGARVTGFGPEYKTNITCPNCGHINKHAFDLSEVEPKPEPDYEELEVEKTEEGTFIFKLPRTGVNVEVKLMTGSDETQLLQTMERREKKGLPISVTTTQLMSIIVSVNGITNRTQISEFVGNMPSYDSRYLREVYAKLVPNIDMVQEFQCEKCGAEKEVDIPITVDFFWS
jgi:rubredoxin